VKASQPEARRNRVVIAHGDRKSQRVLARVMGATRAQVEVVGDVEAAIAAAAADAETVVVVDHALARARAAVPASGLAWIAVPGEGAAPAERFGSLADKFRDALQPRAIRADGESSEKRGDK